MAGVLAAALLPSSGTELGMLRPAEGLRVSRAADTVILETDCGDLGTGKNLEDAIHDLKRSSPGEVFLDTVQFLLMDSSAGDLLPQLQELLRPSVRICQTKTEPDLEAAVQYLRKWLPTGTLEKPVWQILEWDGERFHLEETS